MSAVRLPYFVPASVRVFKVGSTYIAQDILGRILATSTTDASVVINAAVDNMPTVSTGFAGKIFIYAGIYDCKTEIDIDRLDNAYHGLILEGEGLGTQLKFTPASALTHGIFMRLMYAGLKDLLIQGNANTVNLVKIAGTTDASNQHNWATIRGVTFCGPQSAIPNGNAAVINANQSPTSGQTGLLMEGNLGTSYFTANHVIDGCNFFALDNGVYIKGLYADMSNWNNIHIGGCNVGIKNEGTQHNFNNFRIESGGPPLEIGTIGIWCREDPGHMGEGGGTVNTFNNINGELRGSPSYTILWDTGTHNNRAINAVSTPADNMSKHNIVDNNKQTGLNFIFEESSLSYAPHSRFRRGYVNFGTNPTGAESGILQGCLLKQLDGSNVPFTGIAASQGPALHMTTGTANTSMACVFINNTTLGNQITGFTYPKMHLRFIPVDVANVRIFIGLWNQFAAPTATADMLSGRAGVGLWLDTGVSPNWKLMYNDGTGPSSIDNFPTTTVGDTTYQANAVTNTFVQGVTVDFSWTPSVAVRHHGLAYDYKTTNIPSTSTAFGLLIAIQNITAGAARTLRLYDLTYDLLALG